MGHRSFFGALALALLVLPGLAQADGHDERDEQKLLLGTPTLTPNPVHPPRDATTELTVPIFIRPTEDLVSLSAGSEKGKDKDEHTFSLKVTWSISSGSTAVASIENNLDLSPPFTFVRLPSGDGHSKQRYIALSVPMSWNLLTSTGQCSKDGIYSSRVSATVLRVHSENRHKQTKIVATASAAVPSLNLVGDIPTISVTRPTEGLATNASAIPVTGFVTGWEAGLTLNGSPVPLTGGTFSTSVSPPDGAVVLTLVATDCRGVTRQALVHFCKDTPPPKVSIVAPAPLTNQVRPTFKVSYSTAADCDHVLPESFRALIDGTDITSGGWTIGPSSAFFTPPSDLTQGSHLLKVTVADAAGGVGMASMTFFVDSRPAVITLNPAQGAILAVATPTLTASYFDPTPSSGLDLQSFVGVLDGVTMPFVVGPSSATFSVPASGPLGNGFHTWSAALSDAATNRSQVSAMFLVDTVPASLRIASPASESTTTSQTPFFEIDYSDVTSGVALGTLSVSLDGTDITSSFTVNAASATFQVPASKPLSFAGHQVLASIADNAGNTTSAMSNFTILQPFTGPAGTVSGQVMVGDPCHATPLAGAMVSLAHAFGQAVTDSAGRFSLQAPVGLAWLNFSAPGYLLIQRPIQVSQDQPAAMPVVFLVARDTKVTHVNASQGGTVTDSTGKISLQLAPGALPADTDITLTLINDPGASKGPPLRNLIPGVGVRITPDGVQLNSTGIVQVANTIHMPIHPIFSFDWDLTNQRWFRTGLAQVTPDGQFFQMAISHFSGCNGACGPISSGGGGPAGGGGCGGGGGGGCGASGVPSNPPT